MANMKQELDAIEQELENEESFVAFFTKDSDAVDRPVDVSDAISGTETKKTTTFNGS